MNEGSPVRSRWWLLLLVLPLAVGSRELPANAAGATDNDQASTSKTATPSETPSNVSQQPEPSPPAWCWPELRARPTINKPSILIKSIRITDEYPKQVFPAGPSFVSIVELMPFKRPYAVEFQPLFNRGSVLIPSAALVDQNYCLVKDYPVLHFVYQYGFFSQEFHSRAAVPVNDPSPRFLLVYVNAESMKYPINIGSMGLFGKKISKGRRLDVGYTMIRLNP